MKRGIVLLLLILIASCSLLTKPAATDSKEDIKEPASDGSIQCAAARPEVCTTDYDPVCGSNGQTYSNSCAACSDTAVQYSNPGVCPGTDTVKYDGMTTIQGLT
ncbi:MAG TPA: Kazal-type serine protease inhibitor family protein [Candidatus Nanoarchaeia archaeon]|nr:Kazal-type serine protease inhibitor family protein [Candidatus Nanoarchaeia archaeon]